MWDNANVKSNSAELISKCYGGSRIHKLIKFSKEMVAEKKSNIPEVRNEQYMSIYCNDY